MRHLVLKVEHLVAANFAIVIQQLFQTLMINLV